MTTAYRISSYCLLLSLVAASLVAVAMLTRAGDRKPARPDGETLYRSTWCPRPDPLPIAEGDIPERGADITPIHGARTMDPVDLARVVNRLIGQVNPAVEIRSVSVSWPTGSDDALFMVAWERKTR